MNDAAKPSNLDASVASVVADLIEQWLARVQAGEAADAEAFYREHPEQAAALRRLLPAAQVLAELGLSAADGAVTGPPQVSAGEPALGLLGDFRLLREVGRGGMGVVYEAEQISLGRRVALKVLPFAATMDERQLQRFRNEARAAASLEHPHIVPVYGVGCERGVHYFAMKFIDGQTLAHFIRTRQQQPAALPGKPRAENQAQPAEVSASSDQATQLESVWMARLYEEPPPAPDQEIQSGDFLPAAETTPALGARQATVRSVQGKAYFANVARLGIQAAEALEHAHTLGIVHRDVKPANLILDGQGELWVTDFGLARTAADAGLTMSGDLLGTLRYMSPEQALAKRGLVDHRTDIYALGVTLYELLTLQPAYRGNDRQDLLRQITFEEPRPLRRVNRAVPAELATIVAKAMEKNVADRYGTAQELADDLRRFLEDKPIRARPPTLGECARRWSRRHQPLVRAVTVALVLAVPVLAGSTAWALHMNSQTEQARANEEQARTRAEKAAADERQAKTLAEDRRRQAELVAHLLQSVFHKLDPNAPQTIGLDLKEQLLAQLDEAADQLERAAADPLTQAQLQNALGEAFLGLGEAKKALVQLQRAADRRRAQLRPDHPDTLHSLHALARAYHDTNQRHLSLPLFEHVLKRQKALFGDDHADTVNSMNSLALAYLAAGKLTQALPLFVQTRDWRQAKLGPNHLETLNSMNGLALAYLDAGQPAKALPLLKHTLVKREATLGRNHPHALNSRNNLALAYLDAGQPGLAVPLFLQTRDQRQARFGPDHPSTLTSMHNLAAAYRADGKLKLALPLLKETLAKRQDKLGPDHPDTLATMNSLAAAYQADGQFAQAVSLFQQTLALAKAKLEPDHPNMLAIMNNLAAAYQTAGNLEQALNFYEQTLQRAQARLGANHPKTLATRDNLAATYRQVGKRDLSLPQRNELVERMKVALGLDHRDTLISMSHLAAAYQADGNLKRALTVYQETVERMQAKLPPADPNTIATMNNLAVAYGAAGKLDRAVPLLEQTLAQRMAARGPDHPSTLYTMNNLAAACTELGAFGKAEPLLRKLLAAQLKANGVNHPATVTAQLQLGGNLLQQRKFAAAEPILRLCLKTRERFEPDFWGTFHTKTQLGRSLLGQQKYAAAEPLLLQGYEGMKAREPSLPPQARPWLIEAAQCLVELYDAQDNKDQADAWRLRLAEVSRGKTLEKK